MTFPASAFRLVLAAAISLPILAGQAALHAQTDPNAADVGGYYQLESEAFIGYMRVNEDQDGTHVVQVFAVQIFGNNDMGKADGVGRLFGNRMRFAYEVGDGEATVEVVFEGDKARVETTAPFTLPGWQGPDLVLFGDFYFKRRE